MHNITPAEERHIQSLITAPNARGRVLRAAEALEPTREGVDRLVADLGEAGGAGRIPLTAYACDARLLTKGAFMRKTKKWSAVPKTIDGKNPNAVFLGRLGGLKGGHARAAKMTAKERSDAAKKASLARWGDTRKKSGMEDDDLPKLCMHPEHQPPSHLYIPPGKRYRHICPGCGRTVVIRGSNIRC